MAQIRAKIINRDSSAGPKNELTHDKYTKLTCVNCSLISNRSSSVNFESEDIIAQEISQKQISRHRQNAATVKLCFKHKNPSYNTFHLNTSKVRTK